jgi:DNA end-binding protein Ku
MLDPAKHIVDTKKAHFEPGRFEDHYEEALKELLQSGQIEAPRQREPSKVVNLMDCGALLRQNVRVDYGGRPQRGRAIIVLRRRLAVRARGRRKLVSGPPRWPP